MRVMGHRGAVSRAAIAPPAVWLGIGNTTMGLSGAADATALGTQSGAADRLDLHAFWLGGAGARIASLGVQVSTALAASTARVAVYEQDPANRTRLIRRHQTGLLDCATTGAKKEAVSFTFQPGRRYFLGVHSSGTQSFRALPLAALWPLNSSLTSTTQFSVLRFTAAFAGGCPAELTATVASMTSTTASAVLMEWA